MIDRPDPTKKKGVNGMKEYTPCINTPETSLERIEQIIESLESGGVVNVDDITAKAEMANPSRPIRSATMMLLKKYGIEYKEGNKHGG